ncbi:MAG: cyanophycin synthetase [Sphaerochaetaceae bacterium]
MEAKLKFVNSAMHLTNDKNLNNNEIKRSVSIGHSFFVDRFFYLVGIKGTGLSSLALFLKEQGAYVSGSDSPTSFYTDDILAQANIEYSEDHFSPLPMKTQVVIYSASYDPESHPQLIEATENGIPTYTYPEFIALLGTNFSLYGISGAHGKTTTTAAVDWMLSDSGDGYAAIYGSQLLTPPQRGENKELSYIAVEACEYRDHFQMYELKGLVITSIEWDHTDYFSDAESFVAAFTKRVENLSDSSFVIISLDTPSSYELAQKIQSERPIQVLTYGLHPESMIRLNSVDPHSFTLNDEPTVYTHPLGSPLLATNLVAAALLCSAIHLQQRNIALTTESVLAEKNFYHYLLKAATYPKTKQRLEVLAEIDGITYIDDYAHHPKEIVVALDAIKALYPNRPIHLIFHPHTYSRTKDLFNQFVSSLKKADKVYLRPIYASSRNDRGEDSILLFKLAQLTQAAYIENETQLITHIAPLLKEGDVCITMGAGNNYQLAQHIAKQRESTS